MDSDKLTQNWQQVCDQIKSYNNIDPSQINAFFSRLQPQAMSEGFLMLTADNDFIKTWIERHYADFIKQALLDLFHVPFTVIIEVDIAASQPAPPMTQPLAAAGAMSPLTSQPAAQPLSASMPFQTGEGGAPVMAGSGMVVSLEGTTQESVIADSVPRGDSAMPGAVSLHNSATEIGGNVRPEIASGERTNGSGPLYANVETATAAHREKLSIARALEAEGPTSTLTFENFVIGDSNRMAYSMAVAVAEMPGKGHLNPLFIYGKSGLGKTHLMRAIQNYIHETMPHLSAIYVDSAELLSDYMEASAAHDKEKSSYKNFKNRYEEADVLLIDDVQYLQGKKQTLDIVFQIFNKLTSQGKQVVLSADRAPKNIDIDERYKSRFNSGGTFDIQPPEIETKLGIVKSFVEEYRHNEGNASFNIPKDIQMYIAESSSSNIRELKSAVTKVIYQMTFFNRPDLKLEDVRSLLENHFSGGPSKGSRSPTSKRKSKRSTR